LGGGAGDMEVPEGKMGLWLLVFVECGSMLGIGSGLAATVVRGYG
jgi:hypothetical protein